MIQKLGNQLLDQEKLLLILYRQVKVNLRKNPNRTSQSKNVKNKIKMEL
jgi:hypothetical protein